MNSIQTRVPRALRAAAVLAQEPHRAELLRLAYLCERNPTVANATKAKCAAITIAYAYPAEGRTLAIYDAAYAVDAAYKAAVYAEENQVELSALYVAFADGAMAEALSILGWLIDPSARATEAQPAIS